MLSVVAHAQESDYQKSLIAQFRFYNMARTIFAPVYPALAPPFTRKIKLDNQGRISYTLGYELTKPDQAHAVEA